MDSDIDISKSPKEVFLEGYGKLPVELRNKLGFYGLGLIWKACGQPAVNSVRFEFQDWMDGLEASLIKLSRPKPDVAIATLEEAIKHLTNLRNQYLAEQTNRGEE